MVCRSGPVAARLLRLEGRLARAERQLRAALALRGRLRALERRLEGGGGAWQPGDAGKPLLGSHVGPPAGPDDGSDRQWEGHGRREAVEKSGDDSSIRIKQEESCAANHQEGEAGDALRLPCLAKEAFYEPKASSQPKQSKQAFPEELQSEDLQRDLDTGFQTYATHVLPWIKQEEEPHSPQEQGLAREEISPDPHTAHYEDTKKDLPADSFESSACDSDVPGRPKEKFSKTPSPVVPWDSQWNSEMMETNSTGNSLGGDTQYNRGLGEHLDFFSPQEDDVVKRPCAPNKYESNCSLQEQLQAPQGAWEGKKFPVPMCNKSLSRKVSPLHHCWADSDAAPGTAPASGQLIRAEHEQNPADGTRFPDHDGIGIEESEENFQVENTFTTSCCWDHPLDKPEGCGQCRRGSLGSQQQSQGRRKSYICSDCGKSFVCHSWLVRHQMTHTGERPYKCSECDKSYRRKDSLLNHQRRHSGEGLFQCSLCRKRFVLRRSLVKHQRTHMQETHLAMAGWLCAEIKGAVMHSI